MLNINWVKCEGDKWCPLTALNIDSVGSVKGVYIIWYNGNPGKVVRVGQGDVVDRISAHRNDPAILAYGSTKTLFVTWASVAYQDRDGVERYLAEKWNPLVGSRFPDVIPIAVNSPF